MELYRILEDPVRDGLPVLEPGTADMTTAIVTTARYHPEDGPEGYDSPDQVVDIIARVFGSSVEKIVRSAWCGGGWEMDRNYWPHTPQLGHVDEQ